MAFQSASSAFSTASIPANFIGGKSAFAVSMWLRAKSRVSAFNNLFGHSYNFHSETDHFYIRRHDATRHSLYLALDNAGSRQLITAAAITNPLTDDAWYHLYYSYNSSDGIIRVYVNAVAQTTTNVGATGRLLCTPASNPTYNLNLSDVSAGGYWRVGRVKVFAGSTIPTATEAYAGTDTGALLDYQMLSGGATLNIATSGGDRTYLDEDISNYDLTISSGSGTLDNTSGGLDPSLSLDYETITHSGIMYRTDWKKGTSDTSITVTRSDWPSFSLNGGSYVQCTNYCKRANKIFWVIPESVRPTSSSDVVRKNFPASTVTVTVSDFNAAQTGEICTNGFGVEPYPLPEGDRAGLNSSIAHFSEGQNRLIRINLVEYFFSWIRTAAWSSTGIPTNTQNGEDAFAALMSGYSPDPSGNVYVLWRGSASSYCYAGTGTATNEFTKVGSKTTITGPDGETWYRQEYTITDSPTIAIKPVVGSPTYETQVTHVAVVFVADYALWLSGLKHHPTYISRHKCFETIRLMDTMHTNSAEHYDEDDILPDDYATLRHAENRFLSATISSTADYAYSNVNTAYFINGTLFKATTSADHPFHTGHVVSVSSASFDWWRQYNTGTVSGSTWTYGGNLSTDGFTTGLAVQVKSSNTLPAGFSAATTYYIRVLTTNTFTLHPTATDATNNTNPISASDAGTGTHRVHRLGTKTSTVWLVDTDNTGLASNELLVWTRLNGYITHSASGTLTLDYEHLPAPKHIAEFYNEIYDRHGKRPVCWINKPHIMTDAAWITYITRLDSFLDPETELWVEYSNETWNTGNAFDGQFRYVAGMARRLGLVDHQFHAQKSYDTWKITRDACSGRTVKCIVAGQSVNSSVLSSRMSYFQSYYNSVIDAGKPATWAEMPVHMSVATYFDFIDFTVADNRSGIIAAGPLGTVDMGDVGYRDYSPYPALKTTYGKQLVAYEGGANWDTPSDDPPLTRTVFAAALAPRQKNIIFGALITYIEEGGFDIASVLGNETNWSEATGKNWGAYKNWNQESGNGDGSDGKYNNVADFDNYITNGESSSGYHSYVSTRAQAQEEWASTMSFEGWAKRCAVTIPATQVGTGGVADFTVLLTEANLPWEIAGTVSGTFSNGETITQATSGATAKVVGNQTASPILVTSISGTPNGTNTWTGGTSGATISSPSVPVSDVHTNARSDGGDIRFSSDESGNTELAVDLISYDSGTNKAIIRVGPVALSASIPNTLYMWYGNAAATQPAASDANGQYAAYDANWAAYWPLTTNLNNRKSASHTLTNNGSLTIGGVAGRVGNATEFNGTTQSLTLTSGVVNGEPCTLMGLFRNDDVTAFSTRVAVSCGESGAYNGFSMSHNYNGTNHRYWASSHNAASDPASVRSEVNGVATSWQYLASVHKDDYRQVDIGTAQGTANTTASTAPTPNAFAIGMLFRGNLFRWDGGIQHVSAHNVERNLAWRATEENQLMDSASFASAGAPENIGGVTLTAGTLSEDSHDYDSVTLSWTAATDNTGTITEQLERSPAGAGTWANVIGATSSPAIDTTVSAETAYDYRVAYTDDLTTVYSNTVSVTTDADPAPETSVVFYPSGLAQVINSVVTSTQSGRNRRNIKTVDSTGLLERLADRLDDTRYYGKQN